MSDQPTELWFDLSVKVRFINWTDLQPGDSFYYFLKERKNERRAHGPFKMVNPEKFLAKNAQGVQFSYAKLHDTIQLVVPIAPESYIP